MSQENKSLMLAVQIGDSDGSLCWLPNPEVWGATKEEFLAKWQQAASDKIEESKD